MVLSQDYLGQSEGQEEEGLCLRLQRVSAGASPAPEGPAPAQHLRPSPAHSRAAPAKLLGTSPLSGGQLRLRQVLAQPPRRPLRRGQGCGRFLCLPPPGGAPRHPSAGPSRACPRRGCSAAPAPRRRACPPALTILQMEAMFLTVMSLKVAAIPHRHLYKVKTAPLMVGRAQEGRGGGSGSCSGAGIKARGGDSTGTLCARRAARRPDLPALLPPGE